MDDSYDFLVIGAGSGGVRAARIAGALGARTAIIESGRLGGTCVNLGCVPKKLMARAAAYAQDFEDARAFGWPVEASAHVWSTLIGAQDEELLRLNGAYRRMLERADVEIIEGHGRFIDAHSVEVGGRLVRGQQILVATGGRPRTLEVPGAEHAVVSDAMFSLKCLPRRALVVGGGYIALEFAGILRGLGAEVILAHRGSALLRGFDLDLQEAILELLHARGVDVRLHREVTRIECDDAGQRHVTLSDGETLEVDLVLQAIGRAPRSDGMSLEVTGVATGEGGAITVDADYRTSVSHIHAVGDVCGGAELTPVAIKQGHYVAERLFGKHGHPPELEGVPTAVFSQPPIATVGMTEAQARAAVDEVAVYRNRFRPMGYVLAGRHERTLMKLVVDVGSGRVLGCHMVGPDAPEIIQGFAVALKAGVTKAQLDATIGIHPTSAEEFVTMR